MKKWINIVFVLAMLLLALQPHAFGQDKEELQQKRKKLLKDIELSKSMLSEIKQNQKESLHRLQTLQKQIQLREEIISNINKEISLLSKNIDETSGVVTSLENDLKELKAEYARMIYHAYKNQSSQSQLMFVFAAESFNEAFKRLLYLRDITEFRRRQAELIEEIKAVLESKLADLGQKRDEKQELLAKQSAQKSKMKDEISQKDNLIAKLKTKEKSIKKDIGNKEKAAQKLDDAIAEIIRKEIEEARRRAAELAAKEGSKAMALTPEAAKLSASFASNKGKLPWPVERGLIASTFGEHYHPVVKVKTFNNGVNIQTNEKSVVRAVFEGTVVRVLYVPNYHRVVLVSHGDYFTLYSNLSEAFVKAGDKISTKEALGVVYTDSAEGKTEVHFEIWRNMDKLNPELWLQSN